MNLILIADAEATLTRRQSYSVNRSKARNQQKGCWPERVGEKGHKKAVRTKKRFWVVWGGASSCNAFLSRFMFDYDGSGTTTCLDASSILFIHRNAPISYRKKDIGN